MAKRHHIVCSGPGLAQHEAETTAWDLDNPMRCEILYKGEGSAENVIENALRKTQMVTILRLAAGVNCEVEK